MRGIVRNRVRALVVAMCWSLLALGGGAPSSAAGPGVATMSVGDHHACAVRTNGTVWCWGDATFGQVGDGTTGDANGMRTSPVQVLRGSSTLKGVTKVAAGGIHTCAVRTDRTVWCWGSAAFGQLGNGQSGPGASRSKAVQVRRGSDPLTGVEHVTAGARHTCALRSNGSVWCWGYAAHGELGDGTIGSVPFHLRTTAVRVRRGGGYLDKVIAIAAGTNHTCAVRKDGSAWCWGDGTGGQLGDGQSGDKHQRTVATRVRRGSGYLTKASGIAGGAYHTCVRRTDRTAWCWGDGSAGQLGDGTTGGSTSHLRSKAVKVLRGGGYLTGVTGVGAGERHSCARRSDGSAWCWGQALYGQLGDGTTGDATDHVRLKPVKVRRSTAPFTGVRKLDGGEAHTCALRTDKSVWCWGNNEAGQHGRGTVDGEVHPYPRKVLFPWAS